MNASESLIDENNAPGLHSACLSLGSNIQPEVFLPRAVAMLHKAARVVKISTCWETAAFGGSGPNFINLAVSIQINQDVHVLKSGIIRQIENELGRVRTTDKNAPRTIDLDIIVFDGQVVEPALWERAYLALTVAELFPNLQKEPSGRFLPAIAAELAAMQPAVIRPGFLNPTG